MLSTVNCRTNKITNRFVCFVFVYQWTRFRWLLSSVSSLVWWKILPNFVCGNYSLFVSISFTAMVIASVVGADYCSLCNNHVACGQNIVSLLMRKTIKLNMTFIHFYAQQPSPKCSAIPTITTEMKNAIVELHNTYRNQQALGKTGFPTAARMATVVSEPQNSFIDRLGFWH